MTANQPVADMRKHRMRWTTVASDGGTEVVQPVLDPEVTLEASSVTLGPLQVIKCVRARMQHFML